MKTAAIQLFLILYYCLPGLHSAAFPYPHFQGKVLANHSYVDLSQVETDSLHCHTDLTTCCSSNEGGYRGHWLFPNGSRVEFGTHIYEVLAAQKVELHRRSGAPLTPSGIYRCNIQTVASHHFSTGDSVYVGLYPPGEGDVQILDNLELSVSFSDGITLTCISTGGPATTVTWTRDSTTVTEGTKSVLSDPVRAKYTHTLTESVTTGGEYTCTVSNNKPSSASASITLRVPDTPIVGVVSTTATSVTLSCTDPSGSAVISHVLHWQEDGLVRCSDEDEGTTAFHIDESGLTTLNGLEEGMTYKMSVTAINVVGSSEVSETFIVVTEEAAPSGPPTVLDSTVITDTNINISWDEVACLNRNGNITGYRVQVRDGGSNRIVEVVGGFREANISELTPSTEYTVQVAAVNSAGTGPYSDAIVYKTKAATGSGDVSGCTCSKANIAGAVIGGIVIAVVLVITTALVIKVALILLSKKYGEKWTLTRKLAASIIPSVNSSSPAPREDASEPGVTSNEAYSVVEQTEEYEGAYEVVNYPSSTTSDTEQENPTPTPPV